MRRIKESDTRKHLTRCPELDKENSVSLWGSAHKFAELLAYNS